MAVKVAVAGRFTGDVAPALRALFPQVEFVSVTDGPLEAARDAEVALGGNDPQRFRAVLAAMPRLRWYHTMSAGVEGLLTPELLARDGVVLTNNSGAYDPSIAEHVIAVIFAAAKRLPAHVRAQERHEWAHGEGGARHADVRGSTVVVLGMGSIGGEVARLARAIGMNVVGVRRGGAPSPHGRVVTPDRLAEVAPAADYLVVAAPLTAETRGLVSRQVIAALPARAWVINIARGAIVDEPALFEAVRDRRIGGAAIDAWWQEPLPADSPWWDLPNVIVTPHRSWSSPSLNERTVAIFADNLRRYLANEPLRNVVDTRRGY